MLSKILFFTRFLLAALPIMIERFMQSLRARIHRLTYRAVDNPRNIVIIGGSFGGFFLAQRLANSVPTGYRVVLVEKKSHFNFTWIFPRVSVVAGHEHKAFIPYGPGVAAAPAGSLVFRQALATAIDDKTVELQDGSKLDYDYLAIATGSTGSPPWNFTTGEKRDGMGVFRDMQQRIRDAKDLVVVGGGAVGVELATDAKSKYPEKNVSLIHSRERVMNTFGPKLHEYAMGRMNLLGVNVHLGERVPEKAESEAPSVLTLKSGKTVPYDVLIKCVGLKPASGLLSTLSPSSITSSGMIAVKKTLQIADSKYPNVYALGDVAETGGVRMGRAASQQADVVSYNITRAIRGKSLREYNPIPFMEAGIDLTLGLADGLTYFRDGKNEYLMPKSKQIDLDSELTWQLVGATPYQDKEHDA